MENSLDIENSTEKNKRKRIKKETTPAPSPNSLVGKCLVYIGADNNDTYKDSVVYIISSSPKEVQGIIINKLLFGTAVLECHNRNTLADKEIRNVYEDLYQGGPENASHGYVLFPKEDYVPNDPFAEIHDEIAISTSFGILQDILDGTGPKKKLIVMGHCSWKQGKLEWELFNNQWLIVPASSKLVFDTPFKDRWEEAKKASGIELGGLLPRIGLA